MKIIKKILLFIVLLIALVLIAALFIKKDYTVVREVIINKQKQEVFNYIKSLKNQDNYSKWAKMDVNAKKEYSGTDGTVGFVSAWDSQNDHVGKGSQTIKKITEGERIDIDLKFLKPFESNALAYMTTDSVAANQTKVKWGFEGSMPYPMNIMKLVMNMEKMIGDDLQTGLDNLKTVLEK